MGDSGAGLGQHRGTQVGQVLELLTGLHPGLPNFQGLKLAANWVLPRRQRLHNRGPPKFDLHTHPSDVLAPVVTALRSTHQLSSSAGRMQNASRKTDATWTQGSNGPIIASVVSAVALQTVESEDPQMGEPPAVRGGCRKEQRTQRRRSHG